MAIVRELNTSDTYITYLSTVALFCAISCTIVMIKFRGFRASLNLSSGKASGTHYELTPQVSVVGAYRTSKEEYFGNVNYLDARKTITPSMVKLPPSTQPQAQVTGNIKSSRSAGDLTKVQNLPEEVRKSTPNVSVQNAARDAREAKDQLKAQKKLEKQQLIEQKKREKLEAQQREKEEKLRKEREKKAAQQQAKEAKEREKQRKRKGAAPQPQSQQQPIEQRATAQQTPSDNQQIEQRTQKRAAPPVPQFKKVQQRGQQNANPLSHTAENLRNSLESISRNSGPPPYSDTEPEPSRGDSAGNISFVKPAESSSWDLISQHRQQMNRPTAVTAHSTKQKHIDLQYNVGNTANNDKDNSEA